MPDDEISRKTVSILSRCVAFIKMNLHINSTDGVKIKRSNVIIILVHHSCLSVYISASSFFSQKPCHKHLSSHATQSLKVGTILLWAVTMLMCIWVLAFICGHLHEFVDGHRKKTSSTCKHYTHEHNGIIPERLLSSLASWLNAVANLIALLNKCF